MEEIRCQRTKNVNRNGFFVLFFKKRKTTTKVNKLFNIWNLNKQCWLKIFHEILGQQIEK